MKYKADPAHLALTPREGVGSYLKPDQGDHRSDTQKSSFVVIRNGLPEDRYYDPEKHRCTVPATWEARIARRNMLYPKSCA